MEINKFDGKSNFTLWQARVKDVLIQQGLIDALLCDEKPTTMEVRDWKWLQMQAVSTIRMYLADEVVIHMLSETFLTVLWSKLEELYMMKSLTNTLFLWRQFYQLQMTEGQSVQEHLSHFQKILTDLLSVGENVEEKTRALVLLASLPSSYESLVTALLVGKSTIKMDEVTAAILQNEVLRRENPASSSGGDSSALVASGGAGGGRRNDRRSQRGRSKSRRDLSKTRCYRCEELGHLARDCPQLKNRTVAAVATAGSDSDGDVLEISDEVSTSSQQWILDSACPYHVCCREEQFDSLENSEGTVYLPDGSSCAIRGIGTVSWRTHDGAVRRLGEVRYIPDFRRNLISLSRLDSRGYRTVAGGGILRVLRGDRIVREGKKGSRGHYYLAGSPVRGGASGARWSPERGGAPGGGSGTRQETREDERRRRKVRFLLPQDDAPSRSQVRRSTAYDGDGIEQPGSTPMFAHP